MKTRFLFVLVSMLLPLIASAYDAKIDGICYNLNSIDGINTAEVTLSSVYGGGYSGDIVIPESFTYGEVVYRVTSIGEKAFGKSSGMTSVIIPNSVTSLGWGAFSGCSGLTSVTIPNSVTSIGEEAFYGCSGLTSITIPNSVTSIGYGTFYGCSGLTSITIPNSVTYIGQDAFCGCSGLTSVTIPNSVTSIGYGTFDGCSGLTSITIPNSVTSIGGSAFSDCSGLTSITIPNSVTEIGSRAFNGCSGLTSITIPNSVTSIGEGAFYGCSGLTSITIPNSVTEIGLRAFWGCSSLTDVYFVGEAPQYEQTSFNPDDIKNATLHVKDYAIESFKGVEPWTWFKEIVCDEKVTDFNLTYYVDGEVYKTETHKYDDEIIPEIIKKKGMTFSGWDITIPEKMPGKDIEAKGTLSWSKETFGGIIYQVTDTIRNYCAVIGNDKYAGEMCPTSNFDFDEKYRLTAIWKNSFKDNTQITTIMAPDSVVTIGEYAFDGCKNATQIAIDKYIERIGERAFANIDKLTDVFIYAEAVPETDRTAFENSYIEDYVTLHVPAASIDKYKEVAPWKNFKSIVSIEGTEPPQTFKLIYMVDGEVYKTVEIEEGAEITPEAEPTKEGYVFSGWSEIPDVMPSEDVTITGTFTEDASDGDDDDVVNPEEGDTDETNVGEEVIPISGAKQTTWCSAYDLDFTGVEGVKAYIASGYDRETGIIWLTRVNKVPAGEGILIIADKGDYTIPHVSTSAYYANLMVGTLKAMVLNETDGEYTNYYLSNGTSGVGFYKVNGSVDIKANRAYLPLLKGTTKADTRFIGIGFEDEDGTTSIKNISTEDNAVWYNLQGQRVDNPAKGIYIRNGKKVIVR